MYDILLGISIFTVLWMPVGPKMPVDNIMTDMLKLLRLPHIIAFLFFMFALGNLWGFIESYLFLHLKELGASNYLLGKRELFFHFLGIFCKKKKNVNL